ncbi:hypothetical protein [Nannocystis sp.]|uniref:hypothetical protein n=1 Tax=Nannocystis sp. TaxID=1962667 RepID=UPI00242366A5|nr:hypothetical protein [Nannocystis sp.]MBK7824145.1 hypothetical protein [Nannocystis sp.]MBK9755157.1 hypothetical protein [Nannocystis sp.]
MAYRRPLHLALLASAALVTCGTNPAGTASNSSATDTGTDSTSTTEVLPTSGSTSSASGTSEATPTSSGADTNFPNGDIPSGGECNLFAQDCMAGQKCNAWSDDGGIFPNGAKCVQITGDKQPGEGCTVEGKFGDGIDDCVEGSICLDIDNSGKAACVAYCQGDMNDPTCPDVGDKCAFLFEPTVPLCFPACDPLAQDCSPAETCVPNIAALGAEFFVCMPRVFEEIPGQYGDACYALSGCDPSFLCIFAENVPGCGGTYCCSTYCDIDMPETCLAFDDTLTCVPWFEQGKATPGYENVGICGIMP